MDKIKYFISWLLHPIRRKFSYSYRLRRGWGLSAIRNDKELKAIYEFCKSELKESENINMHENRHRKAIYEMTVKLYEQNQSHDRVVYTKLHKFKIPEQHFYNDVEDFINACVGWYWN